MKKLRFEIDGKSQEGYAQLVDDTIWVHFEGRTFQFQNSAAGGPSKFSKKDQIKSGNIHSPMPGKITKVLVSKGDSVEENQSILVLEAMKMEYVLKSQVKGKVREIYFASGTQVALGALLAVIEKVV